MYQSDHFHCSWEPDLLLSRVIMLYLSDQTPAGIKLLREKELRDLRGDGTGVRKLSDRIYDYDVYNDLGNPDRGNDFIRPLVGGQKIPYPRRCRTGRTPSDTDISAESRVEKPFPLYVPRDEQFDESKQNTFSTSRISTKVVVVKSAISEDIAKFEDFKETLVKKIDALADQLIGRNVVLELFSLDTDPIDATNWTWQLAKAHVYSNDAGFHQLSHHWLRTHAAMEPFILSAHRQLSAMHSIYKLLDPHMRYTLEINAIARQNLLNSNGVIEQGFTLGRYYMEISAAAYKHWHFDLEGLPADLIRRGMTVPDPSQRHGLKLLIEDYPYASDGLLIWEAIQNWVQTYVNRYYPDPSLVCNDRELQAWYAEVINVGHADLRYENWWPTLANAEDLTAILTTIIWLASAQHAALNFGQYPYGGYIPNRPPRMRRLIPDENDPEYTSFLEDPQNYFLLALPSMLQSTKYMAVVDTLSTHSPDEEYIGERQQRDTWSGDAEMVEAFYGFASEIQRIEKEIEKRNRDMSLKNRCGAGVLPYELLAPSSEPGVTCRGIPNSVSI
ncbi:linoleate 13S-lipoxygenase 3-1, chloroplastic-like protein [Tanacetum coccineum]